MEETHELFEESHRIARIRRCRDCGQLFLYLFFEETRMEWPSDGSRTADYGQFPILMERHH
jgi:hypothetical protein